MSLPISEATRDWLESHHFDVKDINKTGKYDDIPLILACRQGKEDIATELIYLDSNINHSNMDGTTALWACVVSNRFNLAKKLLDYGANIDHQNDNGATVLMYASSAGKAAWVNFFLQEGADTRLKSLDDFTALDLASNIQCLRLLRSARAA